MDDFSKIPGAEYSRTNLMSRITSSFGKDNRWSVDAKVQYILSDATNRPISGARSDNYFYSMYMMPISLDIREFKQAKIQKMEKCIGGRKAVVRIHIGQKITIPIKTNVIAFC